jgi:hypothetical protein
MGIDPKNAGTMSRLADTFKRYESLRHAHVVPESIKAKLRRPGEEFRLVNLPDGTWEFRPTHYLQHKVEAIDGLGNLWTVRNEFGRQPLRLRIEALMAAGPYDSSANKVLADAESLASFTNRTSSPGVTADIASTTELVRAGGASLRLSATNSLDSARGAWVKFERTFSTPLNLSGHEGIGLWVYGDGQGELLNIQLRCPEHLVAGIGEHYIPIHFTGWRYFELVEPESRRWAQYSWPYGDAYSIYRESVSFGQVSSVSLWLNNIPPGKSVTVHLSPVKALPLLKSVLRQPAFTVNDKTIRFPIELQTGCYLEMLSATDCKVYGPKGELQAEVKPEPEPPTLNTAANQVRLEVQTEPGTRPRANITLITEGPAIH